MKPGPRRWGSPGWPTPTLTVAINLVIAWRIVLLTLLGRECPQLAAEVLF
jgi:hypothetical protein